MKSRKRSYLPALTAAAVAAAAFASAHAATIFSDNFSGGTGDINGTTPDVTTGVNWVASSQFNANGTILNATETAGVEGGSATLAFTPVNGLIYTLDASFTGVTGNGNWLALGFVFGQSSVITADNRFLTDPSPTNGTIGKAWMLYRGDTTANPHAAYLGNATNGDNNQVTFSSFPNPASVSSSIDLRVVLDTTLGTGAWAATWYAKRPADASFTEVRGTTTLLNETINAVGIAKSNNFITGTIESFSLTSVPEPSCLGLLGCGSLLMLRFRRR